MDVISQLRGYFSEKLRTTELQHKTLFDPLTVRAELEPIVSQSCFVDIMPLEQSFKACLLNLAFSHSDLFDLLEDLIHPLWSDKNNIQQFMACINFVIGEKFMSSAYGRVPFILQPGTIFERVVEYYNDSATFTQPFETLYECFPPAARPLLHPYLLTFGFKRSEQFKNLTENLQRQQQHDTICASLDCSGSGSTHKRKL